jgi:2-C-methyl-D-erythritol 2,4-cyclodiphosphate synthase
MTPDPPPKSRRHRVLVGGLTPRRKAAAADASSMAPPPVPFLIGHGYDIHRLQSGGRLMLGGVLISDQVSPIAHSDGDVVLHALVDALLGAMGLGDIGDHFPNSDPRWKSAPSRLFVEEVNRRLQQRGYRVSNVDITILLERPRIGSMKSQIIASLRELLGPSARINIKAGTNEGCDAVGRGEAVAAHAVALISTQT